MDDSDVTYAPTDDDEEEEDSSDSVEFIAETQVQEEEIQSTQLAPPQSSQMLSRIKKVRQRACQRFNRGFDEDSKLDAQHRATRATQGEQIEARERAARRARQEQDPEPRNVRRARNS